MTTATTQPVTQEKLQAFANQVQDAYHAYLLKSGTRPDIIANSTHQVTIKPGPKYTKIDIGSSGRFMVVNETGQIFGIKAYGVIHRGHFYGTLDAPKPQAMRWYW